jgi:hypothetical protein
MMMKKGGRRRRRRSERGADRIQWEGREDLPSRVKQIRGSDSFHDTLF